MISRKVLLISTCVLTILLIIVTAYCWAREIDYSEKIILFNNKINALSSQIILEEGNLSKIQKVLKNISTLYFDSCYYTDGIDVFYDGVNGFIKVEGADPLSFEIITGIYSYTGDREYNLEKCFYSSDRDRAYKRGVEIRGASPKGFQPISSYYMRDENNVYFFSDVGSRENYLQAKIENVDFNSFELLSDSLSERYAKDKNNVYMNGLKLEGCSVNSFRKLSYGYSLDNNNVYYINERILGADPGSFEVLGMQNAKDKNNVYISGKIAEGFDADTYELLGMGWQKDKNTVYYQGKVVKDSDPETFMILYNEYAKDKNNVYKYEWKIEEADADTFFILDRHIYQIDKSHVYKFGEIIPDIDPETFKLQY